MNQKEEDTAYHVIPEIFPREWAYSCLTLSNKTLVSLDKHQPQLWPRRLSSRRQPPPSHMLSHRANLQPFPKVITVLLSDT